MKDPVIIRRHTEKRDRLIFTKIVYNFETVGFLGKIARGLPSNIKTHVARIIGIPSKLDRPVSASTSTTTLYP